MTGTAPGWYRDDPEHPRTLRWYDGARWTQHTRADTDPDVPPGPPPHPPAWTPAYGPPGTYPPPGPPPAPAVRPPLPKAGPRPEDTQRQAIVALGVVSVLLVAAILVVIALLVGYEDPDPSATDDPRPPAAGPVVPAPPAPSAPSAPGDDPADPSAPAEPAAVSPEAVAEAFVTALLDGRCTEALRYLAADLQPADSACAELPLPQGLGGMVEPEASPAEVDGDRARVAVGFASPGSGEPVPGTRLVLRMVREDAGWRIRDLALR